MVAGFAPNDILSKWSLQDLRKLKIKADAEAMRRSLHEFIKLGWHVLEPQNKFVDNWHIRTICEHLEAASRGQLRRLIINIAPRHSKSLLVSTFWNAWEWIQRPHIRFFYTTYRHALSVRDANNTRTLIKSEWFQKHFGHKFKIIDSQDSGSLFENDHRGRRFSSSIEGGMTGEGGDCLLSGAIIPTSNAGDLDIATLHTLDYLPLVLSWNHVEDRYEYRRVQATRKKWSGTPLVRLTTASGRTLVCTEDHKVATTDGYRSAKMVRPGDQVAVRGFSNADVSAMQECVHQKAVRTPQATQVGCAELPMLGGLQKFISERCETELQSQGLPHMRQSHKCAQTLLRRRVSARSNVSDSKASLSDVRHGVRGEDGDTVLRRAMPFGSEADNDALREVQQQTGSLDNPIRLHAPGQLQVLSVRGERSYRSTDGRETVQQPECAPYKREGHGSETDQSYNTLQLLPPNAPHQEGGLWDTVVGNEVICDQSHTVYDLQVEGNHNFFANGVLVHNCLVLDDPHNAREAESEVERQNVIDFVDRAWSSRVNNPKTAVKVVVMQRLHEEDVTSHLLKREAGWEHLILPTEYVPTTRLFFNGGNDPRRVAGELLWPERYGDDEVRSAKIDLGDYGYAAQHQQNPTSRTSGMFKVGVLRQHITEFGPTLPHVTGRGWDFAATTKKDSKRTAGVRMSKDESGRYWIEHVTLGKWSPDDRNETVKARTQADGLRCFVKFEHEGGSSGEDQALSIVRLLAGFDVEGIKVTGDKASRADAFAAQCNAGNVSIVDDGTWDVEAYLSELSGFPEGNYKDQVDASSLIFNQLVGSEIVSYVPDVGVRPPVPVEDPHWTGKLGGDPDWMRKI